MGATENGGLKFIGEFQIAKLSLAPGDVLVARVDRPITSEIAGRIRAHIAPDLPEGIKFIVIDSAIELSALSRSEIEKMAG